MVVLRSSGSRGNDTRTDLLPEEIFRSTASGVTRDYIDPSVSSTVFSLQHQDSYLHSGKNETGGFG